jgi:phospholipase C
VNTRFHCEKRRVTLAVENCGAQSIVLLIWDAYGRDRSKHHVAPGHTLVWRWSLDGSFGWYDLSLRVEGDASFMQRLAGHVEDGRSSMSDPAFGA